MRNWKDWTKKAGIRAIKTVAQAAIAGIGTAAIYGRGGLEICSFCISPCRSVIASDERCRSPGGKHQCLTLTSRK